MKSLPYHNEPGGKRVTNDWVFLEDLVVEAYERKSWGQKQSSEDGKLGSVQWK